MPELADDLARREIAVEALLAGGTERAVERAAGLRRDAERAAVIFGNVDRLDRVGAADVDQPLAGAVRSRRIADDPRRAGGDGRPGALAPPPSPGAHLLTVC